MQTFVAMLCGAPRVLQAGARCAAAQFAVTCGGFVSARFALSTQVSVRGIPRVLARALSQICRKCCLTRVGDCEMCVKWQADNVGGEVQARPGEALNKVIKPQAAGLA